MVDTTFNIKRGDTRPKLTATLLDELDTAIDLTAALAVHLMINFPVPFDVEVDVEPGTGGDVEYQWEDGDTDVEPAIYQAEFEITWASDDRQTVPNNGYFEIVITGDLG